MDTSILEAPRTTDRAARLTWTRGFDNLPREHGFEPLVVEGSLPADLRGTFYWNGPGQLAANGEHYGHWFDGDGAVGAVRFDGARAEGAIRLVQTDSLLAERRAGKRLYSRLTRRSPRPIREFFRGDARNAANVNVLAHRGKIAALAFDTPIEIDAADLSTVGPLEIDGVSVRQFAAHPHRCQARRATYNFAVRMGKRTTLDVLELPDEGRARPLCTVPLAAPTLVHDCAVTQRHIVVVIPPLRIQVLPMLLGVKTPWDALRFREDQATLALVVPIDDPDRAFFVEMPAFFSFHAANAYEEAGAIVVDLARSDRFEPTARWLAGLARGRVDDMPTDRMHRVRIDLRTRRASVEPLSDAIGEMPRVSPRVEGERHRFVYHVGFRKGHRGMTDILRKLDVETGASHVVSVGEDRYPGEAVVAPRNGGAEDDAWLLTPVYDGRTHTSHVAIFDARRPADGPVARAHFDHHVPFHFHGVWVPTM